MNKLNSLETLHQQLVNAKDPRDKLSIVENHPLTLQFLQISPHLENYLKECDQNQRFVILSVLALGQGNIVFQDIERIEMLHDLLHKLVQTLLDLEKFYDLMGGIVGYHLTLYKLILESSQQSPLKHSSELISYEKPEGINISNKTPELLNTIRSGIENLGLMGEIYPLGGAGDRLDLQDEVTGEALPAAQMVFCGRTLFEGLIRDLQGREFLHYKLFGKQITTPIAIMTSHEKNNRQWIENICESSHWFNRPKSSYDIFIQTLVPMMTPEGDWAMQAPLRPILKPGGHGAIWKAAQDAGVFTRLEKLSRNRCLVRQINNPVAGLDHGLLSLIGVGCKKDKAFGFASCERLLNMPEGMNVLREKKSGNHYEYSITNIEYTEFTKHGIEDIPDSPGGAYSRFPCNTNILFANLKSIELAMKKCSLPGLIVNMKSHTKCLIDNQYVEKKLGRLESTMQNIADYIVDERTTHLPKQEQENLKTFLTYNTRRKTISVIKQLYRPGSSLAGTPERCFYELMQNYRDLLTNYCSIELPDEQSEEVYLQNGPNFVVNFHPALGPLYSVIGQKIHNGSITAGSELIMEIAEAEIINLNLQGSLVIEAANVMGKINDSGCIVYHSSQCGRCSLINVTVRNRGRHPMNLNDVLKGNADRTESLSIVLHGNAEFQAENIVIEGNWHFDVPDGKRLTVYQQESELGWRLDSINSPTWSWIYTFDGDNNIVLTKN